MFLPQFIYKQPAVLFGTKNAKTYKGEKLGYYTYILYMSPNKINTFGVNLCPCATKGCIQACLYKAGRGRFTRTQISRINKSEYFLRQQNVFMLQLVKEIRNAIKKYGVDHIAIRLNGTSDIAYEDIEIGEYDNIMHMFPNVQFYDYTKIYSRFKKPLPNNYHLTFSRTENNWSLCQKVLKSGYNVAVVFNVKNEKDLPNEYKGYPVLNGDENDLTFIKPTGNIIGLKLKGVNKDKVLAIQSGFAV